MPSLPGNLQFEGPGEIFGLVFVAISAYLPSGQVRVIAVAIGGRRLTFLLSALDFPCGDSLIPLCWGCWQSSSSEIFDSPPIQSGRLFYSLPCSRPVSFSFSLHPFHLSGDRRWMGAPFLSRGLDVLSPLFLRRGCFIFGASFFFLPPSALERLPTVIFVLS